MKTNSYVQAVKMAMARAELLDMDWYVDQWKMFMITRPRITNHREI